MSDDTTPATGSSQPPPGGGYRPSEDAPPRPTYNPGYVPPPTMVMAPPPPQGGNFKRGFGLGAGLGLGLLIAGVVMSVIGGLISMAMLGAAVATLGPASADSATQRVETVWGNDSAATSETVRAVVISGPIMAEGGDGMGLTAATYGYEVANYLDQLTTDDGKGVVLLVNTPGGSINGSKAIADAVKRYESRTKQKVIAYVRGMSASGGMYAMAGASEIIADHGTLIGSIGVIFGPFKRYKDVVATGSTILEPGVTTTGGITQEYLSQGKGKDFGNPFRDMTAEERASLTKGLENEYGAFVNWVSEARGIPADKIRNELGAYIFDPVTAKQKGLVDQIMGPDEAFRHMASEFGIEADKMRVVRPKAPSALESLLGAEARVYGQSLPLADRGRDAIVTASLCSASPQTLAFHGSLKEFCG